jgi:hypothetical protein
MDGGANSPLSLRATEGSAATRRCRCEAGIAGQRNARPALAAFLCAFLLGAPIHSATTVTSAVSVSIASFCLMGVTSSSVNLTIVNPAVAGSVPANPTSSSTYAQYSSTVAAGVTRRITASWGFLNSAPAGCELRLTATPPTGKGSSAGQITLSWIAQNIVTSIGGCATGTGAGNGAQLTYTLKINTMTSLVAGQTRNATITLTLTDS